MKSQALEHDIDPRSADGASELEAHIQCRLNGQVRDFTIMVADRGLIVRGHARTYYAKQLAQ